MPLLLIIGAGAVLGVGAYFAAHGLAHVLTHFGVDWPIVKKLDGPVTLKGALTSLVAGAAALPATIWGAGLLGAALGVELLPTAIAGAAGSVASVSGEIVDHLHGKQANTTTVAPPTSATTTTTTSTDNSVSTSTNASVAPATSPVASSEPAPGPVVHPAPADVSHVDSYAVVKKDTLWAIAREHHITLGELEAANPQIGERTPPAGYSSPWDYIRVGDELTIPSVQATGVTKTLDKIGEPVAGRDQ